MQGLIPKKIIRTVLAPFLFLAFGLYPVFIAEDAYATNLLVGTWSNTSYSGAGNYACSNGQPNYGTWEPNTLSFSYIQTTVSQSVTIAEPSQVLFLYNARNRGDNPGASITVNVSDSDQTITSGNYVPPTASTQYGIEVTTTTPNEVVTVSIQGADNRGWAGCYGSMLTNLFLTATQSAPVVIVEPTPTSTPTPTANSVSITVNEGEVLSFNVDGAIVTSVLFASYGTPNNYVIGQCHADNSLSLVTEAFVGRSNGSISADNGIFGDPCGGTYKRLSVILIYEITAPLTSPEPTPSASPSPTPETSTAPSPSPSPTIEPEPSPTPTALPTPEPSQEPTPEPSPLPSPSPDASIEQARLEAERLAALAAEEARQREIQRAAEAKAREEEAARLKAEEERLKAEAEQKAKEEEEARLAEEQRLKEEAEAKAEEERLRLEAEAEEERLRLEQEEKERIEAEEKAEEEKLVAEEKARIEKEKLEQEEAQRLAEEEAARLEEEKKAEEEAEKEEKLKAEEEEKKVFEELGLEPNNPSDLPVDEPKLPEPEKLVPRVQEDKAGVENGGIEFFGTQSQPQVIGEDGQLTPPPPLPGSGDYLDPEAITTADTFIGQAGGVTFNAPDIAVPVLPIEINIELPGIGDAAQAAADAYVAMANVGNDMSPITRKKAKKILVATIIASTLWRRFGD